MRTSIDTMTNLLNKLSLSVDEVQHDTQWDPFKKNISTYQVNYDALAASHALYRLYENDPDANGSRGVKRWMELDDLELPDLITEQDRTTAQEIRKYYSHQLMLSGLSSEREFSNYMKQLASIVDSDGSTYTSENRGVYYRLPEYHAYDVTWDQMVATHFQNYSTEHLLKRERRLNPVRKMFRRNRMQRHLELWFSDVSTSQPVNLVIDSNNSLNYIVEHMFDLGQTFAISTNNPGELTRRGTAYMYTNKWQITNLKDFI